MRRLGLTTGDFVMRTPGDIGSVGVPSNSPREDSLQALESWSLSDTDRSGMLRVLAPQIADETDRTWIGFECTFRSGVKDRIALQVSERKRHSDGFTEEFLSSIWPVLREDCLSEIGARSGCEQDKALLWTAYSMTDLAILVLDEAAMMLRINVAARQLIESGSVLRRSHRSLVASTPAGTRLFHDALAACLRSEDPNYEKTILLEQADNGLPIPMMLSRFFHEGRPTRLVTAAIPTPPDGSRIETLGRTLGLTCSEARVASLMQQGLSNREAAHQAGLKEQTFNTYAKRVLNKLKVRGRTEMAQLLTWQSAGRRKRRPEPLELSS